LFYPFVSVSKKRADVRKADDDDENRELLELAREAELDIDEDFRFDVDDGDLEENDIEVVRFWSCFCVWGFFSCGRFAGSFRVCCDCSKAKIGEEAEEIFRRPSCKIARKEEEAAAAIDRKRSRKDQEEASKSISVVLGFFKLETVQPKISSFSPNFQLVTLRQIQNCRHFQPIARRKIQADIGLS
jgi:hypothetical protein